MLLVVTASSTALALALLLLPAPAFATIYGDAFFPALSALFATSTSWTHLPLGIAILPISCGIFLWRTLMPTRRLDRWRRVVRLFLLALLLLSLYLVTWGANYRRPGLLELLDVSPRETTQAEIDAFAGDLLGWVRATASELEVPTAEGARDGAGPLPNLGAAAREMAGGGGGPGSDARPAPGAGGAAEVAADEHLTAQALAAISGELEQLALELGWPATVPPKVKLLPPGTLLSSGYAGMLFPFTLEPQVDAGLTHVSRVAIGAHELAHAAGFANEADADMAALIASLRADNPLARYALSLSLLSRSLDSLSEEERAFVASNLPVRALRDLVEARERSRRYFSASLATRVTAVYDRLLEGQGVEAGVDTYRRAPALGALLAAEGLLPPAPLVVPDGGVDESGGPALARPEPGRAGQSLATLGR